MSKGSCHGRLIPRTLKIELVVVGILILVASVVSLCVWRFAECTKEQLECVGGRKERIWDELRSLPNKTKDELLADNCEKIVSQRLFGGMGVSDIDEFYLRRNSITTRYEGNEILVANIDRAMVSLPEYSEMVIATAAKREELYRTYNEASRASVISSGHSGYVSKKDEFETSEEYQARIKNDAGRSKILRSHENAALDALVDFEKACNPTFVRSSANGFYTLKETLIFVPYTDWAYDADHHQFIVAGRSINPQGGGYDRSEEHEVTLQAFHFTINDIRASQFVKSGTINLEYKPTANVWGHPSKFKNYKQQHPFLLLRIGSCDLKVQGCVDRVLVMPWHHEVEKMRSPSDDSSNSAYKLFGIVREEAKPLGPKYGHRNRQAASSSNEKDAGSKTSSIFEVAVIDRSYDESAFQPVEAFADYKTPKGREEIERVLKHFESIGGAYYCDFCKAVRQELKREELEGNLRKGL